MTNSPEVGFDITRRHAKVGHRNINILATKII
jgi:hypothetical protein